MTAHRPSARSSEPLLLPIPISRAPPLLSPADDFADRDGGDIFGTKSKPGIKRGRYWDDRLQAWTDKPSPAIERLMYSEATMPGDVATMDSTGIAEGQSIWNRMASIIRARSLDIRILMDAHDRRNFGFVDIPTFRRSLCYAFDNQWIDLAMTSEELKEICAPYLTRKPNAKGEPEAFVMWQKFTTDLQALADKKRPTNDFLARLAEVEARERASAALVAQYGVTEFELKSCLTAIKDRLLTYNKSLNDAFRRIDGSGNGFISAEEIKTFFRDAYLGAPRPGQRARFAIRAGASLRRQGWRGGGGVKGVRCRAAAAMALITATAASSSAAVVVAAAAAVAATAAAAAAAATAAAAARAHGHCRVPLGRSGVSRLVVVAAAPWRLARGMSAWNGRSLVPPRTAPRTLHCVLPSRRPQVTLSTTGHSRA